MLFAGLRVVSVSNISLVSVAALLGIGNLGMLFTSGLQRDFVTEVVVGIIAILILALLMDAVLVLLERLLTPWTRAAAAPPGRDTAEPPAGSGAAAAQRLSDRRPEAVPHEQRRHGHHCLARPILRTGPAAPESRHGWPSTCSTRGLVMLIATAIAVPVGLYVGHTGRGRVAAVAVAGALRALPTLGLLTLFVLLAGIGLMPPIWALVILTVPPLLAGTYAGISSVDRNVVDAARAMGMTELQVLFRAEFPNAPARDVRRVPHRRAPGHRHRLGGGLHQPGRPRPVPLRRPGPAATSPRCWAGRC